MGLKLAKLSEHTASGPSYRASGRVVAVRGAAILARVPLVTVGSLCRIERTPGEPLLAEAISFEDDLVCLAPFDHLQGISPGARVESSPLLQPVDASFAVPGAVLDALGRPLNQFQPGRTSTPLRLNQAPPAALSRQPITEALETGVQTIDGLCTLAYGQRIGLFASAGVGKSTLLGMISRNAAVDISVIALVGERGREVREFIENCLGEEGLKKAIVIVSTSDEALARRKLAAITATAIAELYRERGQRVLLLVDSLTRMARAIRDIGLASGEIPVRHGYPSSVYLELPRLLERAGNSARGSITAIYTVLTNELGDTDPLAEEVKSLLDGHIVLNPELAARGIRPAIDPLMSVSRLCDAVCSKDERDDARMLIRMLARLKKDRDILLFGGIPDHELQVFLTYEDHLIKLLTQASGESVSLKQTRRDFHELSAGIKTALADKPKL